MTKVTISVGSFRLWGDALRRVCGSRGYCRRALLLSARRYRCFPPWVPLHPHRRRRAAWGIYRVRSAVPGLSGCRGSVQMLCRKCSRSRSGRFSSSRGSRASAFPAGPGADVEHGGVRVYAGYAIRIDGRPPVYVKSPRLNPNMAAFLAKPAERSAL